MTVSPWHQSCGYCFLLSHVHDSLLWQPHQTKNLLFIDQSDSLFLMFLLLRCLENDMALFCSDKWHFDEIFSCIRFLSTSTGTYTSNIYSNRFFFFIKRHKGHLITKLGNKMLKYTNGNYLNIYDYLAVNSRWFFRSQIGQMHLKQTCSMIYGGKTCIGASKKPERHLEAHFSSDLLQKVKSHTKWNISRQYFFVLILMITDYSSWTLKSTVSEY